MEVLLGTFLPVLGAIAIFAAARVLRGPARALVMTLAPILLWYATLAVLPATGRDGNMLAVVIVMLFAVALCLYYPTLLVVWIVRRMRAQRVVGGVAD